jgi:hypothetical protein
MIMRSEAHKRASKKYYASPKGRASLQRFAECNPLKVRTFRNKSWAKWNALKRKVTVGDLTEIAKVYERRSWWGQWFDVVVDHIVPLFHGGTHEAKNLQIIYRFENSRKGRSLNYKPRVIFS